MKSYLCWVAFGASAVGVMGIVGCASTPVPNAKVASSEVLARARLADDQDRSRRRRDPADAREDHLHGPRDTQHPFKCASPSRPVDSIRLLGAVRVE